MKDLPMEWKTKYVMKEKAMEWKSKRWNERVSYEMK